MDEERMSLPSFESLPAWAVLHSVLRHTAVGIALGVLYFRGLWWNARHFIGGAAQRRRLRLMVGRFVLGGRCFAGGLRAWRGAPPLWHSWVAHARSAGIRRIRETAP